MESKELRKFLKGIATQRRRLISMGVSRKPTDDLDIRKVEHAAEFQDPREWMINNRDIVYLVCPKQSHKKMENIYNNLK